MGFVFVPAWWCVSWSDGGRDCLAEVVEIPRSHVQRVHTLTGGRLKTFEGESKGEPLLLTPLVLVGNHWRGAPPINRLGLINMVALPVSPPIPTTAFSISKASLVCTVVTRCHGHWRSFHSFAWCVWHCNSCCGACLLRAMPAFLCGACAFAFI